METNNQNLPPVPMPPEEKLPNTKLSPLRYIIFAIASLLSVLILAAGWEMLVLVPLGGLFIAILVAILIILFRKKQADNFTITVAFAIIFLSIFSFRINLGVTTDNEKPIYWGNMLTSEKLEYFHSSFFDILIFLTAIFFLLGLIYLIWRVILKGNLGKKEGTILLSFFIFLLGAHFYIVVTEGRGYLKQLAVGQRSSVYTETFENRYASYVKLDRVFNGSCVNTANVLYEVLGEQKSDYNFSCISTVQFDGVNTQLPAEHKNISEKNYPEANPNFLRDQLIFTKENDVPNQGPEIYYNEGDIISVTVEVSSDSYIVVDAPGNKTMPSYGVTTGLAIGGTSESVYDVRTGGHKVITVFYPINISSGLDKLYIYISPRVKNASYKILEIARIEGPFEMPEKIKEWQKEVNQVGI